MIVTSEHMICLVTRIKVKRLSSFLNVLWTFYRIRWKARNVTGLFESSLFVRRKRTIIFISLWRDSRSFAEFATAVPEHAKAVLKMYRIGAETWSGVFTLHQQSNTSQPWGKVLADGENASFEKVLGRIE